MSTNKTKEPQTSEKQEKEDDIAEEQYKKLSSVFLSLEDKGLPVKNAAYDKVRVEYVRGDDLLKVFKENLQLLCKEIKNSIGVEIDANEEGALQQVYEEFNRRNMMVKAVRFTEDGKIKYPKRLAYFEEEDTCCGDKHTKPSLSPKEMKKFDEKMFYVLDIHRSTKQTYFWLFVVVTVVLMYCLFPVWPYEVKVGIWWVSYILLNLMLGLMAIRIAFYLLVYVFGADFWIFPNLHDDKLGIVDSFKPLYSFAKRTETTFTIIVRLGIVACLGYMAWYVYENPNSIYELGEHVADVYVDVFDWGKEKIVNYGNSTAVNLKNQKYMNPGFDLNDDL